MVAGRYCAYCGQREFAGPHTIRGLILPSLQRVLGLEGGLLHTIVHLTIAPGRVVREYLSGRMTPYTHPAAYLLISFAAFALLSNTFELVEPAMDADPTWAVPILFVAGLSRLFFWRARFNYAEHLILVIYIVAQILLFLGLAIGGLFLTVGSKISVPILLAP